MKQIIQFESRDGEIFSNKKECQAYEDVLDKTDEIMSTLKDNSKVSSDIAVKQDIDTVKTAFRRFLFEVCLPAFSDWEWAHKIIKETAEGTRHNSWVARLLSDNPDKGKVYWETYFRFLCINPESGIEYQQPYYVEHEGEFKGEVI